MYGHAIDQFRRHGYDATSIEMITNAAGVSRRTFFNYFPSKEHVLARLHRQVTLQALEQLQTSAASALASVRLGLLAFAEALEGEHRLAAALLRVMFSSDVLARQDDVDAATFFPALVQRIESAQSQGELACCFDASAIASHLMAITTGALTHWALTPEVQPGQLVLLLQQRVTMAFEGLLERPGKKP